MSVADLRARLKKATGPDRSNHPMIPLRTCIDILMKVQPEISTKFWFTLDGKEIVTEQILDKEIISILRESNQFRARVSEIARELNIDQSVIESRCVGNEAIELILSDAVLRENFWYSQIENAKMFVEKSGTVSIAQLTEKLSLPLDLVLSKIVPHLKLSTDGNRLISLKYSQIIAARVIGVMNGLTEPRTIKWIADFVDADSDTVRSCVENLRQNQSFGDLGKDDIFIPKIWIRNQADQADRSLGKYHWCTNAGLKALVLEHGKSFVGSRWRRSGKNFQFFRNFHFIG